MNNIETRNNVGVAIKVIGILEIIGGIVLFLFTQDNYFLQDYSLLFLVAGIVFGIMFFGFSEIIVLLQRLNDKMDAIAMNQHSNSTSTEKEHRYNLSAIAEEQSSPRVSSGDWICKDCGKNNHSFDQTCSSCGAPKK